MAETKTRKRSRLYPRYTLQESVSFIKVIERMGGRGVAEQALASSIGKGVNNSGFIGRLSAAKQFGLLLEEQGKLSLTELGNRIARPSSSDEPADALKQAFARPPLYAELAQVFNGRILPELSFLSNRLVTEFGIEGNAKDGAAKNFLKSAEYADVIRNGVLIIDEGKGATKKENATGESDPKPADGLQRESNEADSFHFSLRGGIELIIPRNERTTSAVVEGELKAAKDELQKFAQKFVEESEVSIVGNAVEEQNESEEKSEAAA